MYSAPWWFWAACPLTGVACYLLWALYWWLGSLPCPVLCDDWIATHWGIP